ncbi:hypothetical protein FACS18942_03550 [Planctomycetales bacterium]|nr:hypothetical protein FACS18942_03550 [Planctomycetales bacterium]
MQLIINADDLGFSPAVNDAVIHSPQITAASLMVNMPFAEEAVKLVAEKRPDLSLALHFTLTSGKSVAAPQDIPLLVDADGMFRHGFLGLWKGVARKDFLRQTETEFDAQLSAMDNFTAKYGIHFDHLDSHQHVHCLPGILELLQDRADERQIRLRIPREPFRLMPCLRNPVNAIKRLILNWNLRCAHQSIGYFGILESGKIDEKAIRGIVRYLNATPAKHSIYEINVHPSTLQPVQNLCCSRDDAKFHQSVWRRKEYEAVHSAYFVSGSGS